jgi:flagellar basal-body rod modification protein FlgD
MADTTTGVGSTNSADALTGSASQVSRNVGGTLGKDDFLKLLVGQMKNMDPLGAGGKDPSDTMAQMTQYSMLEQMQNLNASTQALAAQTKLSSTIGLIGHSVTYSDDQGNPVQGQVETVQTAGSKVTLTIDGKAGIDPTTVIEVR